MMIGCTTFCRSSSHTSHHNKTIKCKIFHQRCIYVCVCKLSHNYKALFSVVDGQAPSFIVNHISSHWSFSLFVHSIFIMLGPNFVWCLFLSKTQKGLSRLLLSLIAVLHCWFYPLKDKTYYFVPPAIPITKLAATIHIFFTP